jgi:hypothetical protein
VQGQGEVVVQPTVVTEMEQQQVPKDVCDSEWDSFEQQYKYKCRTKYVYEDRPVQKTRVRVSGAGLNMTVRDVYAAFSIATVAYIQRWRLL